MDVNISRAADLFFPNPSLELVYFEAIANAIDAGATRVDVQIKVKNLKDVNAFSVEIKDNGEGFKDDNFNKFKELLKTEEKDHKGVGRLVFLKYFRTVDIESYFDDKKRTFKFDRSFDGESLIEKHDEKKSGTILKLSGYRKDKIKAYNYLRPLALKRVILLHFFPLFYQKKLAKEELLITISLETTEPNSDYEFASDYQEIRLEDLPTLEKSSFHDETISLVDEFHLYYSIQKKEQIAEESMSIIAVCVDNRTVEMKMPGGETLPDGYELIFLLISDYLTGKVDTSRQELDLPDATIKQLKRVFKKHVSALLKESIPEIIEKNRELKNSLQNTYPHLHGYFKDESIGIADRSVTLEAAQMRFFQDQKKLLEATHLNDEQYDKALEVSSRLLMEYILYREFSLKRLKEATDKGNEDDIHDVIIPKRTYDHNDGDIDTYFKNNVWIFDDKFMTYSSVLSERRMDELLKELAGEDDEVDSNGTRPDIAIIFSDNPEKVEKVDVVIIELKQEGIKLAKQEEVVSQLKQRARILNDKYTDKIQRVWYYGVAEIDVEFERSLLEDNYVPLYSKGKMLYGEEFIIPDMSDRFSRIPIKLFVLNYDALISDAEARNSSFMQLLKKSIAGETR
ncbi:ATP-binding protein [Algibacter pectinivorans]|uniref:Histidine kinase-, DNA gyrase B-, and HSP90-like ATPase n=1 Tax=Algibacter pectinivorans TaxID=870482 RepID=A0A1I1PLX7_9FLAO|nr:ATP-binding protein [Algibacter pectinivorans]SFD10894.1 Histidine kinase-, DNA gyrase B-, and HSP90-like ATPase [Algibacter pectinivorans]